ncbi:MAG TPA: Mur ligase domain-containing protein [Candidatus Saccharimonadales bacterium]|nr:Mur ligase domain-containing protein [Candidatus Saccharimonadales bacterium]
MHIYFSGIGGAGIGPLALIAHQAGFAVSGSDKQDNNYIHYLQEHGVTNIHVGQSRDAIAEVHHQQPIDWYVYSSALIMEHPDAPELQFCRDQHIKATKRDELLNFIIEEKHLKMIAIAGTHGKTTTTAMVIWLMKQLGMPVSYSVGAKLSFGDMGEYDPASEYFVYEADEFDRNFLSFKPALSLITGIDWDHPDIYPTRDEYNAAFRDFLGQSQHAVLWQADMGRLSLMPDPKYTVIHEDDPQIDHNIHLLGLVNRQNAWQVAQSVLPLTDQPLETLLDHLNRFPGLSRRFEQLAPGVYTDYAHTPPKIRGALQLAHEVAGDRVVVVYEGLHNTRQHFIQEELKTLFDDVKQLYIVPTYLAREDQSLQLFTPADLKALMSPTAQAHAAAAELDEQLASHIREHAAAGDTVLCITAGGGHSLDEWLRKVFLQKSGGEKGDK